MHVDNLHVFSLTSTEVCYEILFCEWSRRGPTHVPALGTNAGVVCVGTARVKLKFVGTHSSGILNTKPNKLMKTVVCDHLLGTIVKWRSRNSNTSGSYESFS